MQYIYILPALMWGLLGLYFVSGKKTKALIGWVMVTYMLSFLGAVMLYILLSTGRSLVSPL